MNLSWDQQRSQRIEVLNFKIILIQSIKSISGLPLPSISRADEGSRDVSPADREPAPSPVLRPAIRNFLPGGLATQMPMGMGLPDFRLSFPLRARLVRKDHDRQRTNTQDTATRHLCSSGLGCGLSQLEGQRYLLSISMVTMFVAKRVFA